MFKFQISKSLSPTVLTVLSDTDRQTNVRTFFSRYVFLNIELCWFLSIILNWKLKITVTEYFYNEYIFLTVFLLGGGGVIDPPLQFIYIIQKEFEAVKIFRLFLNTHSPPFMSGTRLLYKLPESSGTLPEWLLFPFTNLIFVLAHFQLSDFDNF